MGLFTEIKVRHLLRGIEHKSEAKRARVCAELCKIGSDALAAVKGQARSIRKRDMAAVDAGGDFDFDAEIELNETVLSIERDHGIGMVGRLMGPPKQ